MKYEEMKEAIKTIETAEKAIMRPLTEEEISIVLDKGLKGLFEEVRLDDQEVYSLYHEMIDILATLFTRSHRTYAETAKKCSVLAGELFKRIGKEILKVQTFDKPVLEDSIDPVGEAIKKLKNGETLELEDELLNQVIDHLWETEKNIRIEVKNGKICLK